MTFQCFIPTCHATDLHDVDGVSACNLHGWVAHYYELAQFRATTPVSLTKRAPIFDDGCDPLTWYEDQL
ncbi:hypothetical protein [Nocardia sp. NPDC047038]|uniref:hypothetical protein n=1 Tax=Nocardia sp. NPDC047038 TaxID=3154338 RepID=UPI0033D5B3A5